MPGTLVPRVPLNEHADENDTQIGATFMPVNIGCIQKTAKNQATLDEVFE